MTVVELLNQIKAEYNATNDTFFTDTEIYHFMYRGQLILATEAFCIEGLPSTVPTVIGTRAYDWPTGTIGIKRLEYNGQKLKKIDFTEDDYLTGSNNLTTSTGSVAYYSVWQKKVYLRPIPDSVYNLQFYTYKEPTTVTAASTLEIPTEYHACLVNYALHRMYGKDKDFNGSAYYKGIWETDVLKCVASEKRKRRTDQLAAVKDESELPETILGTV